MNYIPNTLLRENAAPPSTRIVKRFYKPHVQQIKQKLDQVKELGAASADEWSKGLAEEGRERINDTVRWEQWEARGGLKKVNLRPQVKTIGGSNSLNTMRDQPKPREADSHGSVLQQGPSNLSYNNVQVPNTVGVPADSYQYPQHPGKSSINVEEEKKYHADACSVKQDTTFLGLTQGPSKTLRFPSNHH